METVANCHTFMLPLQSLQVMEAALAMLAIKEVDVAAAEQREHQNSVVTEDGEGGEEEDRLSVTEGDVREADLRRIDGGMNVERFCKTDYCLIDAAS